jgi:signal transduction protein with GAF and PtsI domain
MRPVEEIVTTDASRSSALPPGAQPVAIQPDLPERDPDIEAAGDRIAEAITYLNTRRRDRHEAALRALNQAEAALNRALRTRSDDDRLRNPLRSVLKDLDTAERAVQRGSSDAAKQLSALNKNLDNLP